MATNNFLPFCPTDSGTNLLTQSEYSADAQRTVGNQPGVARSKLVNKAIRQSAWISSVLAQYLSNVTGDNVLDDQNLTNLLATMGKALDKPRTIVGSFKNSASATAGNTIVYSTVNFDTALSPAYNPATGEYTAQATGYYLLCAGAATNDPSMSYSPYIGGVQSSMIRNFGATQAGGQSNGSALIALTLGDILTLRPFNGNASADTAGFFTIAQIH